MLICLISHSDVLVCNISSCLFVFWFWFRFRLFLGFSGHSRTDEQLHSDTCWTGREVLIYISKGLKSDLNTAVLLSLFLDCYYLFYLIFNQKRLSEIKISFGGEFWPRWAAIHQFQHKILQHKQTRDTKNSYISLSQFPFAE